MEAGVTRHEHAVGSTLWLPLFDELSDPTAVARLAAKEEARLVQRPRVPVWVAGAAGDPTGSYAEASPHDWVAGPSTASVVGGHLAAFLIGPLAAVLR
jgi:hypothetical protein